MTKKELRKHYLTLRNALLPSQVESLSSQICTHILHSPLFAQATTILAYHPLGNEVDIRPVIEAAWRQKKEVAFPKVLGEEMDFFVVTDFSQLQQGAFGVMEPVAGCARLSAAQKDILVLTPGVAFDKKGNRLGFGKGYYDKYFAERKAWARLGISYSLQAAEALPADPYDLPLPFLVTEEGMHEV